jgi:hypothetical protein
MEECSKGNVIIVILLSSYPKSTYPTEGFPLENKGKREMNKTISYNSKDIQLKLIVLSSCLYTSMYWVHRLTSTMLIHASRDRWNVAGINNKRTPKNLQKCSITATQAPERETQNLVLQPQYRAFKLSPCHIKIPQDPPKSPKSEEVL